MKTIATTLIVAAVAALASSGAAWADPPGGAGKPSPTTVTTGSLTVTTGSVSNEPTDAQRMKDCMAIWEPRTHMTKQQWRRSCATTLQSLSTD